MTIVLPRSLSFPELGQMNACPTFGPDGDVLPTDLGRGLVSYAGDERARRPRYREHLVCGCSLGVRGSPTSTLTFRPPPPLSKKLCTVCLQIAGIFDPLSPFCANVTYGKPLPWSRSKSPLDADAPHTLLPWSETSVA